MLKTMKVETLRTKPQPHYPGRTDVLGQPTGNNACKDKHNVVPQPEKE